MPSRSRALLAHACCAAVLPGLAAQDAPRPPAWPEGTRVVSIRSAIDGSEQPATCWFRETDQPQPLLLCLHTWSGDHRQRDPGGACARWCAEQGWAFVQPECHGQNRRPEATGSLAVIDDAHAAVAFARQATKIDATRIYVFGSSGGGHLALLLAGRAPELWAGVSAWVPITDLARWHGECVRAGRDYAKDIVASCGGVPGESASIDREYALRSPLTWLPHARGLPLDLNAGIHDGHSGSVPVGHVIRAFDLLATPDRQIGEDAIEAIEASESIPQPLTFSGRDSAYGDKRVLLRRECGAARLTLFDGGHEQIVSAALSWLAAQRKSASR